MSKRIIKTYMIYALIILAISLVIQGTIAYIKSLDSNNNNFIIGTIIPEIIEDYDSVNNIRKNVRIKNIGNYPMYVRVSLVYYFKNNENQIIQNVPILDNDYSITFSSSSNWIKSSDGYYYYKSMLKPNETTDNLIDECFEKKQQENSEFVLDVVVQAIQAIPDSAVEESWNIIVEDDKLLIN